jgi:hypothetical protein
MLIRRIGKGGVVGGCRSIHSKIGSETVEMSRLTKITREWLVPKNYGAAYFDPGQVAINWPLINPWKLSKETVEWPPKKLWHDVPLMMKGRTHTNVVDFDLYGGFAAPIDDPKYKQNSCYVCFIPEIGKTEAKLPEAEYVIPSLKAVWLGRYELHGKPSSVILWLQQLAKMSNSAAIN